MTKIAKTKVAIRQLPQKLDFIRQDRDSILKFRFSSKEEPFAKFLGIVRTTMRSWKERKSADDVLSIEVGHNKSIADALRFKEDWTSWLKEPIDDFRNSWKRHIDDLDLATADPSASVARTRIIERLCLLRLECRAGVDLSDGYVSIARDQLVFEKCQLNEGSEYKSWLQPRPTGDPTNLLPVGERQFAGVRFSQLHYNHNSPPWILGFDLALGQWESHLESLHIRRCLLLVRCINGEMFGRQTRYPGTIVVDPPETAEQSGLQVKPHSVQSGQEEWELVVANGPIGVFALKDLLEVLTGEVGCKLEVAIIVAAKDIARRDANGLVK